MNEHTKRLISHIVEAGMGFLEGSMPIRGVQQSLMGNASAIEDLSPDQRNDLMNMEGELDMAEFIIEDGQQRKLVAEIIARIKTMFELE